MSDDGNMPYGDVTYADPGYQSDGVKRYPVDTEAHCRAAWSYINQAGNAGKYTAEQLSAIKGRIKAAAKRFGIDIADDESSERSGAGPVEERAAALDHVDFGQRILTLVAVPYEQSTQVEYRGEIWNEVFSRSAFNGFEPSKRRVPVSAVLKAPSYGHGDGHLVGRVTEVLPDRGDGLVLDVRISDTPAGTETLQLARDDALSPSVGFAARGGDQMLDRRNMTRRINRAFLDHLSMVPIPAYGGARVLGMRDAPAPRLATDLPRLDTPALDEYFIDPVFAWADERLGRE
jgi:phage head maturation protease